jgi:hypothetical protein
MFPYSDPVGTGLLGSSGALEPYRLLVRDQDHAFGKLANSAYVDRDAFLELAAGAQSQVDTIDWLAFPLTAAVTDQQIDANRVGKQDEYVEWRVEKDATGVTRITFSVEFPEYYQALAEVSQNALVRGIQEAIPGANPTAAELFGADFNPATASGKARAAQFRSRLTQNPWNNGQKGILCLAQRFNTLEALFNLVGNCAIVRTNLDPSAVCANVGGACGPGRASDPRVCQATQLVARAGRAISLDDPAGIRILRLEGIWQINAQDVDVNDPAANQGTWKVSRNGRRGVLQVSNKVTLDGDRVTTGAQVARAVRVGADVISARVQDLPVWATPGKEALRTDG